jgi:hypothetical protein
MDLSEFGPGSDPEIRASEPDGELNIGLQIRFGFFFCASNA